MDDDTKHAETRDTTTATTGEETKQEPVTTQQDQKQKKPEPAGGGEDEDSDLDELDGKNKSPIHLQTEADHFSYRGAG